MSKQEETKRIHLKNVRLSFPSVFKKSVYDGKEGKYEATFLIPKSNKELKKSLDIAIAKYIAEAKIKIAPDKICLKDGDEIEYDGYADHWAIKASNSKRPNVFHKDGSSLTDEDGVIYAGCWVYAIVDFWVQNNKYGKRLNANLYGIRFVKDDEPFGAGPIDVSDEFDEDAFSESDDDDM